MARGDWKAAGYDLDAPVVDAVDVGNVEVNDQGVGGDSRTCFTADTGSCSFQRTPTASWHTWPGAGCAVVAKRGRGCDGTESCVRQVAKEVEEDEDGEDKTTVMGRLCLGHMV